MRETTKIEIGKLEIEHYTYMTAREGFVIRKLESDEEEQTQKITEMLVVSVNGKKEKVWDTLMDDLTINEFSDLQNKLAYVINPEGKSASPSSTTETKS